MRNPEITATYGEEYIIKFVLAIWRGEKKSIFFPYSMKPYELTDRSNNTEKISKENI